MNKIFRLVSILGVLVSFTTATKVCAQPTITRITPTIGINKGTISLTIIGSGFQSESNVTLTKSGSPDIIGTPTTVIEPNTITTTFDIKNVQIGSWSVVVTNPDSLLGTLTNGFRVIPQLLITEVYYDSSTPNDFDEFVEIYNNTAFVVNLSGYKLSDIEGTSTFPTGSVLPSYATIIIAQRGTVAYTSFQKKSDFEWKDTDSAIPNMIGNIIQLANSGDEVLLLDNADIPIDVVTYKTGSYPGVIPHSGVGVSKGKSLQRTPPNQDTDDCSVDFKVGTPTPTTLRNIVVSPTSGRVGSFVTITGQGFFATERIVIDFGTTSTIATTTTDDASSFSTTFTATLQSNWGTVSVSAKGLTSKAKVTTEFNLISLPSLKFDKQVTPSKSATPGATLTYTLSYENIGLGTATNVVLIDAIPAGTIYITNSASGTNTYISYSHDGGLTYDNLHSAPVTHIRWELTTDIAPGSSGNASFAVRIK